MNIKNVHDKDFCLFFFYVVVSSFYLCWFVTDSND